MKRGRKPLGKHTRSAKIVVCLEEDLRKELESLARESQRSMSDYCRYVLTEHFWAVREAEGLAVREE